MNFFYYDLFSPEDCKAMSDEMFMLYKHNRLAKDETVYTSGSMGAFNLNSTFAHLPRIEKRIKSNYGDNIKFENTFSRIYQNGNDLKIHTDRPGLDITLSACLYTNLDQDWPIYVSNDTVDGIWDNVVDPDIYKRDYKVYSTPVGTGVACLGTRSPHWRDTLVCRNDQYVVQVFYHWSFT